MTLGQRDHWPRAAPHPYRFCAWFVKERLDHKGRRLRNSELWNPKVKEDLDLPRAVGRKQEKFNVCGLQDQAGIPGCVLLDQHTYI